MGLFDQSDEYLRKLMETYGYGDKMYQLSKDILDMRQKEKFKTAYDLQAQSAKKLVKVTWVLAITNIVLVIVTILAPNVGAWLSS